jgi:superkiller protein 3
LFGEQNSKRYPQAIVAFQSALRGAPDDVHTWIKLGVAYRSSGKYIAALKVFAKALSLDPDSWYAKFSIGDVQREIGLLEPAIKTFREILVERPSELGVKVVLAETALAAGLHEFRGGFIARAEQSFIEALSEATEIIDAGSATRIAWKIVGDSLTGLGKVPEPALLSSSRPLALRILDLVEEHHVDSKIDGMDTVTATALRALATDVDSPKFFLALSVLAFKMRVLLETQNEASIGSAWLDLGVSLAGVRPHLTALGLSTPTEKALHQAIRCLKFALHKEPLNSIFWNALGVLSFDLSPRLAQHCFIKSIEHNSRSAVPWTNLGLFYLVHGDEDLANQSFLKAQVIDPEWAAAWVGQATLADMAGHAAEASVLLEHAFSLGGSTPEADIGFATRAFDKFRSRSEPDGPAATAALSAPLFALTRYLAQRPNDVSGLHLNALILEQVGDLAGACESLEKAASLLEELYEVDESANVEAQFVIAQTNLGRVRLASEDYAGGLTAFEAALSLINLEEEASSTDVGLSRAESVLLLTECKLGSSLAHFWLGDSSAAEEVLDGAMEDLDGIVGSRHANLAVAMGRVYWAEGDEDKALASFMDAPDS